MSEKEVKKERVKGFAGVIAKNLEPVNNKQNFKEDFANELIKILLNAKDGKYAALITIDHGKLTVSGIENEPKENLKKEKVGWDGFLEMTTNDFFQMAMGKLSTGKMLLKIITHKMKVKNSKKVQVLSKLFSYLGEEAK
jgi:hypothetical protein